MEHRDEIGFQVRTLSNLIRRMVDQRAFPKGEKVPTGMHGWIMGYLYEHRDQDVFQRDIQEQFSIRRSTVTGILQLMEKNGLVTRSSVEQDARLKKLELTQKGIELHERVERSIRQVEDRISNCLTPEEKEEFIRLCEKIRENLQ